MHAADSVAILEKILCDPAATDRTLVTAYLETKKILAEAFEALSVERYADPAPMQETREALEAAMRTMFPHLPSKYLRVLRFGSVHALLLAYFKRRIGIEVSANELRMLTGDAVHTERRARDLRDLGFQVEASDSGGTRVYKLHPGLDIEKGATILVANNIKKDKSLKKIEKEELLYSAGLE